MDQTGPVRPDRARSGEVVVLVVAVSHRREVYERLGELLDHAVKRK